MTKCERLKRLTVLCLLALAVLLWSMPVVLASFRSQPAVNAVPQKSFLRPAKSGVLVEEFSFLIKDFKIDHQGENNNLNITIRYRYRTHISNDAYPDFTLIAKDIETLLTNYPNENDYWEIVNKNITSLVLQKYPAIERVSSELAVSPSPHNHYSRSSIATRERTTVRPR